VLSVLVRREEPLSITSRPGGFAAFAAGILIASAASDSFDVVRAWKLVAAAAIGYMVSRGLAKSGTK
jgi:hypothetical protein